MNVCLSVYVCEREKEKEIDGPIKIKRKDKDNSSEIRKQKKIHKYTIERVL